MASSASSQQQTPTSASSSHHLPCIRALHLNATTSSAVLSVARAVKQDQEASGQNVMLALQTLAEAKIWSPVVISSESWAKVSALRTELISESDSLVPVVTAVNPAALYLYEKAMVVQLHAGAAPLRSFLTTDQDCGLLIPLSISDGMLVTAWDETRSKDDVYRLELSTSKAFVVSGTSWLSLEGGDPLLCVVFCLAAGAGGEG